MDNCQRQCQGKKMSKFLPSKPSNVLILSAINKKLKFFPLHQHFLKSFSVGCNEVLAIFKEQEAATQLTPRILTTPYFIKMAYLRMVLLLPDARPQHNSVRVVVSGLIDVYLHKTERRNRRISIRLDSLGNLLRVIESKDL